MALRLTQDDIAERLEVTKSAVSGWENNKEKPSFDKLPSLRDALQISLDELVCGFDAPRGSFDAKRVSESPPPKYLPQDEPPLTKEEVSLVHRIRNLSARRKKGLAMLLDE